MTFTSLGFSVTNLSRWERTSIEVLITVKKKWTPPQLLKGDALKASAFPK
jgi:hypothetical protein